MNEYITNDSPDRFEAEFNDRLEQHDYQHIFLHGCCYHFALKLNELYQLELRYIPSNTGGIGHCWAKKPKGRASDINGVMDERLIIQLFDNSYTAAALDISKTELEAALAKKGMSETLNRRAFALAESIIKSHHRFKNVIPFDPFTLD